MTTVSHPESDIDTLATQYGFTRDAVAAMARSLAAGRGRMAQFDHPEFGGAGQWMHGGMLMIADHSNRDLRERIARLCDAIAQRIDSSGSIGGTFQSQSQSGSGGTHQPDARDAWWPASLGDPDTSGAQNDMRYAWFARARRLAIDVGGVVTVYDTGDHVIGGVSQQQGHDEHRRTPTFTSQLGPVDLAGLKTIGPGDHALPNDPFVALEKLAALHEKGVIADVEFAAKKAELLRRI
jgi:hypothetical protein